jgi:glycine cleavage system H protein
MTTLIPVHLRYTKEHEWASAQDDNIVAIGITHHAQQRLGDVVYLELPPIGKTVEKDKIFGTVESVKAVSDLFSPLTGVVVAVNEALVNHPEDINQDPYKKAWMIKIRIKQPEHLDELMDSVAYARYLEQHTK